MPKKPVVTITTVADIKALRLYCFASIKRSDSEWTQLHDALYAHMNPEFGDDFVSRRTASGFTNIKMIAGVSKDQATLDLADVLKTLVPSDLQAFVQACEFAMPENPAAKTTVWLVSFISSATAVLKEHQAQVVFMQEPIGFLTGSDKPKRRWKFWK